MLDRDAIAVVAMGAIVAQGLSDGEPSMQMARYAMDQWRDECTIMAEAAYVMADEMIKARQIKPFSR